MKLTDGLAPIALVLALAAAMGKGAAAPAPSTPIAPVDLDDGIDEVNNGMSDYVDEPRHNPARPPRPDEPEPEPEVSTKLERNAAAAKINLDPNVKYCPVCFTKFLIGYSSDGAGGWGYYDWHVQSHNNPNIDKAGHLWSEACPFDGEWFYTVYDFVNHLNIEHSYAVQL